MARQSEFYKGRRKKRSYAFVPTAIAVGVITLIVVLFYGMQKYAVISKDGVSVELPILNEGKTIVDSQGHVVKNFEKVNVSVSYDEPDYLSFRADPNVKCPPVRAIFVPAENVNKDKLVEYASRLVAGNALVLEMKPRSGQMLWESHTRMADSYSLSAPTELTAAMPEVLAMLKEQDIYLAAQISCCIDELLPTRTAAYCIHTEAGLNYRDGCGSWLDAYNLELRTWIAEMAQELYALGFDEVVLADVAHPAVPEDTPLLYTREISTPRSTEAAVCGLAAGVAEKLKDREGVLSIYVDTSTALVRTEPTSGQNAVLFMKLFDRVYLRTDKYAYPYNVDDVAVTIEYGNVYDRLVPVVENYIPENTSWILVDVAEEE